MGRLIQFLRFLDRLIFGIWWVWLLLMVLLLVVADVLHRRNMRKLDDAAKEFDGPGDKDGEGG